MEQRANLDTIPARPPRACVVVEDDAILLMDMEMILRRAGAEIVGLLPHHR